jgi:hypothetical protein
MADRYWRGGTGTWNTTSTTNWSDTSGGAGGASAPTSVDNVFFDANSNTGTGAFTVTVSNSVCNDFTASGLDGTMTLAMGSSTLNCFGSMTFPATNRSVSGTSGKIRFLSTSTGKTITTNGVTLGTNTRLSFEGVGGGWTLGSALTISGSFLGLEFLQGSFSTGNFNVTCASITSQDTPVSISLGSSTITLSSSSPVSLDANSVTLNAGTSSIVMTSVSAPTFEVQNGGLTFYNVSFTGASSSRATIVGNNTFNNLSIASRAVGDATKALSLDGNQTINGTLTLGAANTTARRVQVISETTGTQRTITLNGTLATLTDVDFRDIATAGSVTRPWTGTRLGNGLNNSGITFDTPKTVYWNLVAGGSWNSVAWATSSGGTPDVNNFPLAQDKVIIEDTGLNTGATVSIGITGVWIGELDASTRSLAMTLSTSNTATIYKNIALSSSVTMTGAATWTIGGQGTVQTLTIVNAFVPNLDIDSPGGTFRLTSNTTFSRDQAYRVSLISGTLDLNNFNLTCTTLNSSYEGGAARSIAFGTGVINITGGATTNFFVLNFGYAEGFTCTGSKIVNLTYSGAVGTRYVLGPRDLYEDPDNSLFNLNITGGTDTVNINGHFASIDTTGSSVLFQIDTFEPYLFIVGGNLTLAAAPFALSAAGTNVYFYGLGGTQQITTNGQVFTDCLVVCSEFLENVNTIFAFQDALTMAGSSRLWFIGSTLQLTAGTTNTIPNLDVGYYDFLSAQRYLQSTTPGVRATIVQTSGTVNAVNLTIRDSNATGGATFNAATNLQNINAGNNTGWNFAELPQRYRLGNTGIFYTSFAELDEVTQTQISMSETTFFAAELDEVTTIPVAMRQLDTETVIVQTEFDEVAPVT